MKDRVSDLTTKAGVGKRLSLTRQALGLSQREFCERAKIAPNTYNQYEAGVNMPQLDKAIALCEAHDLTLDWIFRADPGGLTYELADAIRAIRTASRSR